LILHGSFSLLCAVSAKEHDPGVLYSFKPQLCPCFRGKR
jgi:hypothetical protein